MSVFLLHENSPSIYMGLPKLYIRQFMSASRSQTSTPTPYKFFLLWKLQISLSLRGRRPKILPLMAMYPSPIKYSLPTRHVSPVWIWKTTLYISAREGWNFITQMSSAVLPLSLEILQNLLHASLVSKWVFNKLMALSAKRTCVSSYAVGKHIHLFRYLHLGIPKNILRKQCLLFSPLKKAYASLVYKDIFWRRMCGFVCQNRHSNRKCAVGKLIYMYISEHLLWTTRH